MSSRVETGEIDGSVEWAGQDGIWFAKMKENIMLRRHYVDCRFGQLHVTVDESAPSDAAPLILLNSRMRSLLPLLPLLRTRHRPIIVDIPGMALSSPPPQGSTMPDVADCLVALLDAWNIGSANFFGMHTGHKVATAFASDHPGRVGKLVLAGKTHSIVGPLAERNASMQGYIAKRPPDVLLVQLEGKFIDDPDQQGANEAIYAANFAFDFAEALGRVPVPTLIIEIVSEVEDREFGRQAEKLATLMPRADTIAEPQIEPTGLEMYIGSERMARIIDDFIAK